MSRRCLLITFPPGFQLRAVPGWWPPPAVTLSPLASPHSRGSYHFQSPGQNYKLPLVKIYTSVAGCLGRGRFIFIRNGLNHRSPGLDSEVGCGKQTVPRTPSGAAYLSGTINQKNGKNGNHLALPLLSTSFSQENPDRQTIQCIFKFS